MTTTATPSRAANCASARRVPGGGLGSFGGSVSGHSVPSKSRPRNSPAAWANRPATSSRESNKRCVMGYPFTAKARKCSEPNPRDGAVFAFAEDAGYKIRAENRDPRGTFEHFTAKQPHPPRRDCLILG